MTDDCDTDVFISLSDFQSLKLFESRYSNELKRNQTIESQNNILRKQVQQLKLKNEVLNKQKKILNQTIQKLEHKIRFETKQTQAVQKGRVSEINSKVYQQMADVLQTLRKENEKKSIQIQKLRESNRKVEEQKQIVLKNDLSLTKRIQQLQHECYKLRLNEKQFKITTLQSQSSIKLQNNPQNQQFKKLIGQRFSLLQQLSKINTDMQLMLTNKQQYFRGYLKRMKQHLLKSAHIKQLQQILQNQVSSYIVFLQNYKI